MRASREEDILRYLMSTFVISLYSIENPVTQVMVIMIVTSHDYLVSIWSGRYRWAYLHFKDKIQEQVVCILIGHLSIISMFNIYYEYILCTIIIYYYYLAEGLSLMTRSVSRLYICVSSTYHFARFIFVTLMHIIIDISDRLLANWCFDANAKEYTFHPKTFPIYLQITWITALDTLDIL